ncbi:MAG: hypothetical protein WCD70_13035, partial [Alphaproteobacteria bacterium]
KKSRKSDSDAKSDCAIGIPWAKRMPQPDKICFVTSGPFTGHGGDERMVLDLAANLGQHFSIPSEIHPLQNCTSENSFTQNPRTLFVMINCYIKDIPAWVRASRNVLSVGIQNDISFHDPANVLFDPSFYQFTPARRKLARLAYDFSILPSRVGRPPIPLRQTESQQCILPKKAGTFSEESWPILDALPAKPIIAIMARYPNDYELGRLVETCKQLNTKQGVRVLISTGPASGADEENIAKAFEELPDAHIYRWHTQGGKNNPYLSMIARADYLVTSGTLSTTADLVQSGKPVFYVPRSASVLEAFQKISQTRQFPDTFDQYSPNEGCRVKLFADGVVKIFDGTILDHPESENDAKIRKTYTQEWDKIGTRFAIDVTTRLQAFDPACHCMKSKAMQPING